MSAKRTVTCLRSPSRASRPARIFSARWRGVYARGEAGVAGVVGEDGTGCAHSMQNRAASGSVVPHDCAATCQRCRALEAELRLGRVLGAAGRAAHRLSASLPSRRVSIGARYHRRLEAEHGCVHLPALWRPVRADGTAAGELPDLRGRAGVRRLGRPAVDDDRRAGRRGAAEPRLRGGARALRRRHPPGRGDRPAGAAGADAARQRDVGLRQPGGRGVNRAGAGARRAGRHRDLAPALLRQQRRPGAGRSATARSTSTPPTPSTSSIPIRPCGSGTPRTTGWRSCPASP